MGTRSAPFSLLYPDGYFLSLYCGNTLAFAATASAIIFSIIALFKKQNKLLAITGGMIALVLFIGMIFPWVMYRE